MVHRNALAQVILMRRDEHSKAACGAVADLLGLEEGRKAFGAMMSGLDICYALPGGHPLLGRRMPDLDLDLGNRTVSTCSLHAARPVLLNLAHAPLPVTSWADQLDFIEARAIGDWDLPLVGTVPAPNAVLIRPDEHAAWVGAASHDGLHEALAEWFDGPDRDAT